MFPSGAAKCEHTVVHDKGEAKNEGVDRDGGKLSCVGLNVASGSFP